MRWNAALLLIISSYCHGQYAWFPVGTGTNGGAVFMLASDSINNVLYVSGPIDSMGGIDATIAKWDGVGYSKLGCPIDNDFYGVASVGLCFNGDLYCGGDAVMAKQYCSSFISTTKMKYDFLQNSWDSISSPICCELTCVSLYQGSLVFGGTFNYINNNTQNANNIVIVQNNQLQPLGPAGNYGLTNTTPAIVFVSDAIEFGGELFVSGVFSHAGWQPLISYNIARWNGLSWQNAGSDPLGYGYFCIYHNELYLAVPGDGIYKWTGTEWIIFTTLSPPGIINDIVVWDDKMVVTGYFSSIGGVQAKSIAMYDGINWSPLGTGLHCTNLSICNSTFENGKALAVYNGDLIVGGYFNNAGGINANNIARYSKVVNTSEASNLPFEIHPNPTTGMVKLNIESSAIERILIVSMQGDIYPINISPLINLGRFSDGIYLIVALLKNGNVSSQKIIIAK